MFASNADPALGRSTSPVFRQADGFAQEHVEGARYATPHGWIRLTESAAATILRRANLLPLSTFANGKQDVAQTGGARIFSSEQGTWLVVGAILTAWTEAVGFPTGEQNDRRCEHSDAEAPPTAPSPGGALAERKFRSRSAEHWHVRS